MRGTPLTRLLLLVLTAPLAACSNAPHHTQEHRPAIPAQADGAVPLYPLPASAVATCRSAQRRARITILCPLRLPRTVRDSAGTSAFPSDPLAAQVLTGRDVRTPTGFDFSYSAPTEDPRHDGPERFLHFDVRQEDQPLPRGARPATLGGKTGLLAHARSRDYTGEPYFANHARFFWTEGGVKYAATLHNFGEGTEPLLGRLIADLRPAATLEPPAPGPPTARAVTTIPVPVDGPVSVASGEGVVWVAGQGAIASDEIRQPALLRIDPLTRRVAGAPIKISRYPGPTTLAVAPSGQVWVGHREFRKGRGLRTLDPATGRFTGAVDAGPDIVGVALARDSVWALDFGGWPGARRYRGGLAVKVDPRTHRVVARVRVGRAPSAVAIGAGGVWVTNNLDGTVTHIDPQTARVAATIRVGRQPTGIYAGAHDVWVANNVDGTLSRIEPATNAVIQTIPVGTRPRGIALAADGSVWVANSVDDTVSRVDPTQGNVVETVTVGAGPAGLSIGAGALWVANNLDGTVTRIEP